MYTIFLNTNANKNIQTTGLFSRSQTSNSGLRTWALPVWCSTSFLKAHEKIQAKTTTIAFPLKFFTLYEFN